MPQPRNTGRVGGQRAGLVGRAGRPQPGLPPGDAAEFPFVQRGHVGISCAEPRFAEQFLLNRDGIRMISGGARFNAVKRVGRKSVPDYDGHDPIRLAVSIVLDGWIAGEPVEYQESLVNLMTTRVGRRMPKLKLAASFPSQLVGRRWMVEGIPEQDSDPAPIIKDGRLYRLALSLTVIEDVPDELLDDSIARSRRRGTSEKKMPLTHTVKDGESDLGDVSKAVYGNRNRAVEIALFNAIPVGTRLRPGQKLRIP